MSAVYQLAVETIVDTEMLEAAHEDVPLRLAEVIHLPEFGGQLTELALREAIRRGEIHPERRGRLMFVSKRIIREWREFCRKPRPGNDPRYSARQGAGNPTSGFDQGALAQMVSSAVRTGSSNTPLASQSARDAVLMRARSLSKS